MFPAYGSSNSAMGLTPDELAELTLGSIWVDVCKLPIDSQGQVAILYAKNRLISIKPSAAAPSVLA